MAPIPSRTYVSIELTSKHGRMFVVRTIELYNISPPCRLEHNELAAHIFSGSQSFNGTAGTTG